jgi:hypothetical protein
VPPPRPSWTRPYLSARPRARRPVPRDLEVFPASLAAPGRSRRRNALGVAPPSGYDRPASPRTFRGGATGLERTRCLPRVLTPSVLQGRSVYVTDPGLPHPVRSASRVSHPPGDLLRPDPSGLVSSRWHSRGSALQSLSLSGEPWRLSAPDALLTFTYRGPARRPPAMSSHPDPWTRCAATPPGSGGSRDRPPSGPCSPRESVARRRWFRPPEARCSPGLPPLQGLLPRDGPGVSRRAAPLGFDDPGLPATRGRRLVREAALRSIQPREIRRSLSRAAAPPEVSHLVTPLGSSGVRPARAHDFTSGPGPRHRTLSDPP